MLNLEAYYTRNMPTCAHETLPQSALEDDFELALMLQYNKE